MNLRLNRKQLFIILALFAVCLAGAAGLYWFVLAPAKSGLAGQKAALKSEQQVLSSLQSKKQQSPELQLGNVVSLMRKIPAKPLAEQVLLQFRMAEAFPAAGLRKQTPSRTPPVRPGARRLHKAQRAAPHPAHSKKQTCCLPVSKNCRIL